jgi:AcrR family transcriptional regulator
MLAGGLSGRRRTQASRSEATRAALMDATISCLIEEGYDRTTTAAVAARAGVSRGAHLHHFQTRAALVAAAIERLAHRRVAELMVAADGLPEGPDRTARGLDLLWEHYASPLFQGALDLWAHGRTDRELREHLVRVERVLDRQVTDLSHRLLPKASDDASFERFVEMAVATVRGLALLDTLEPAGTRNARQWAFCRAQLVEVFESATVTSV